MNTISFQNRGLIDLRAVRTFGVSAKDCKNPIGFFGTGLKYAIAICLRLGGTITLYRGLERYEFSTSEATIRNSEFRIVTMNGEELGFTTDLGKTWEPWQAFRELYCNTMDEGGSAMEGDANPLTDYTTLVVSSPAFYSAYIERNSIILTAVPRWKTPRVEIHDRHSHFGFYRGIRVAKLDHHDPVYCRTCGQEDRDCYCDPSMPAGCHRSHPHEDMDAGCERLTEVARRGAEKTTSKYVCSNCHGEGVIGDGDATAKCMPCKGRGTVNVLGSQS